MELWLFPVDQLFIVLKGSKILLVLLIRVLLKILFKSHKLVLKHIFLGQFLIVNLCLLSCFIYQFYLILKILVLLIEDMYVFFPSFHFFLEILRLNIKLGIDFFFEIFSGLPAIKLIGKLNFFFNVILNLEYKSRNNWWHIVPLILLVFKSLITKLVLYTLFFPVLDQLLEALPIMHCHFFKFKFKIILIIHYCNCSKSIHQILMHHPFDSLNYKIRIKLN